MSGDAAPLRTIDRAADIMDLLQDEKSLGVSAIAERLEIPKSTVHDYLRTLVSLGYVTNDGGSYSLGFRLLQLGGHVKYRNRLFHVARPQLERLADATGELASVNVEARGLFVILHTELGTDSLRLGVYPGMTTPIHTHAAGKSILAALSDERVDGILADRGLQRVTEYTTTDVESLRSELDAIRERGYGVDWDEQIVGMGVVAAPVETDDRVLGSVGLVCPTDRLDNEGYRRDLAKEVKKAANVIAVNYQYRP